MNGKTRTILVIDSDASIIFYLTTLLVTLGYSVLTARSAEEAIRLMQNAAPTLVLTEIALPKMNGLSLLKYMHESSRLKSVPVILLTSETDPGMKDTCIRAGCAAYLNKPFEPDTLYRSIRAATESVPRRHVRLSTSFPVLMGKQNTFPGGAGTEYATAMSEGGIYVRTLYPLPVGTVCPLTLCIGEREMKVSAVVLYSYTTGQGPFREPGMGMKFLEIAEEDGSFIRDFIQRELTCESRPDSERYC